MVAAALCIRLLWLLLVMQLQKTYVAFPDVFPSRLQHFEYESISFKCEGFEGSSDWGVTRKIPGEKSTCGTKWGVLKGPSCIIRDVYVEDSGEYWCDTGDGQKRNVINITVTAGTVIMETPVLPVIEGDYVTLRCRNKTASNVGASFYKNGLLVKNVSTGNLTIRSVSRADEGLYKCSISGAGVSPESWLSVREHHKETTPLCSDQLPVLLYLLTRTVATVLWAALLLFVLKRRSRQHRGEIISISKHNEGSC